MIKKFNKMRNFAKTKMSETNSELIKVFWIIILILPFISFGLFFLILIMLIITIFSPLIAITSFFYNIGTDSNGVDINVIGKNTPIPAYCYKKDNKVFCDNNKMSKKDKMLYDSIKEMTKNYDYKHPIALDWAIAIDYQNFLDNRYKDYNLKSIAKNGDTPQDVFTLNYKRLKAINDFRQDDVLEQPNENENRKNEALEMTKKSNDEKKNLNKFTDDNTLLLLKKQVSENDVINLKTSGLTKNEERLATFIFNTLPKEYKKIELVAGILANMKAESSLNYKSSNNGNAFGLFQWTGSRKNKLLSLHPINQITEQDEIEYFWSEFQNTIKQKRTEFQKCTSAEDYAKFIDVYYEISELTTTQKRQDYAKEYVSKLSKDNINGTKYKQLVPIGYDDIGQDNKTDINTEYLKVLNKENWDKKNPKLQDFKTLSDNLKKYYKIQFNLNTSQIKTKIKELIQFRKMYYNVVLQWISSTTPREEVNNYNGDVPSSDGFIYPFKKSFKIEKTQHFWVPSIQFEPTLHGIPTHRGVDWGFGDGSTTTSYTPEPIYAPTKLKIIRIEKNCPPITSFGCGGGFGNYIYGVFKYQNKDYVMIFGHNSKVMVNVNDEVEMGNKIAEGGSSGNSVGSHSHIEIQTMEHYNKTHGNTDNDQKDDYLDAEKLFGNKIQLDKLKD